MPRTKISRKVVNTKRLRDNTAELEEIGRDFEIEAENSIQMLQSEHNKSLREIDAKFEELLGMIPPHVLHMKIGEVKEMKSFNEVLIDEKMSNLNVTVKETVTKGDEGMKLCLLMVHWCLFQLFSTSLHAKPHSITEQTLSSAISLHPTCSILTLKGTLQKVRAASLLIQSRYRTSRLITTSRWLDLSRKSKATVAEAGQLAVFHRRLSLLVRAT